MRSVDVSTLYLNKNFVYAKNELKYTIFECPFVFNYFQVDGPSEQNKGNVKFFSISDFLAHGHPIMTNYKSMKEWFQLMKVKMF